MLKHLVTATVLLAPAVAHAEFLAAGHSEVRKPSVQRTAKTDRSPARARLSALPGKIDVAEAARGLEIDDVLAKVNGVYMAGLQRCYRKSVAADPFMSNKVNLELKVSAEGRVISAMRGGGMERCLSTLMSHWRFGIALDDTGTPTEASFKISLVLR
jgi:hypothetical protein